MIWQKNVNCQKCWVFVRVPHKLPSIFTCVARSVHKNCSKSSKKRLFPHKKLWVNTQTDLLSAWSSCTCKFFPSTSILVWSPEMLESVSMNLPRVAFKLTVWSGWEWNVTLTSEVSRWQFFQACDTEWNVRFAWSNLPPWSARKNDVNGSC